MCCEYITLPLARRLTADEQAWVSLHPCVRIIGGNVVRVNIPCKALKRGRCKLYGQEARPSLCSVWPDDPNNQAPDGCIYKEVS